MSADGKILKQITAGIDQPSQPPALPAATLASPYSEVPPAKSRIVQAVDALTEEIVALYPKLADVLTPENEAFDKLTDDATQSQRIKHVADILRDIRERLQL